MKLRDSGGLPCPKCGSPLKPCKCERGDDRISRFGSTLKVRPKTKLKTRSLKERKKDKPLEYGQVFEEVRRERCFGLAELPGHRCGIGVAGSTAHHIGKDDLDGLLPTCGSGHDDLHERVWKVAEALRTAGKPPLHTLAEGYVRRSLARWKKRGELNPEVETAAIARGLMTQEKEGNEC
ncbi:unnamed protein product [marine sediment metagenome]|uniref:Uncharacterized protein n=1 Tax=marine sediment metagenome TaxID=412755 RepID=X0V5U1_9ZZZZ